MEQAPTQVIEIHTNLDDVTGEIIAAAVAELLDAGALDVWTTPITMKHGRPGVILSLLCPPDRRDAFADQILQLTGAFGVRFRQWDRVVLDRRHESVDTRFGAIRIKVGSRQGRVVSVKPEFADVAALADQHAASTAEVMAAARAAADAWAHQVRQSSQGNAT